jgi:pantothenate kinase
MPQDESAIRERSRRSVGGSKTSGAGREPTASETLESLLAGIDHLGRCKARVLIGLVGPPGSGKSTLAALLHQRLGMAKSAVAPMDGFHLPRAVIGGTPLAARRGAIDTFDGWGYLHLLEQLLTHGENTIYAPAYSREIEDPVAGAIAIPSSVQIVIAEGNYLLVDSEPWRSIHRLLAETWFVDVDYRLRRSRLIQRHIRFGKSPSEARAWAVGTDAVNATLVASTRNRADRIVRLSEIMPDAPAPEMVSTRPRTSNSGPAAGAESLEVAPGEVMTVLKTPSDRAGAGESAASTSGSAANGRCRKA